MNINRSHRNGDHDATTGAVRGQLYEADTALETERGPVSDRVEVADTGADRRRLQLAQLDEQIAEFEEMLENPGISQAKRCPYLHTYTHVNQSLTRLPSLLSIC